MVFTSKSVCTSQNEGFVDTRRKFTLDEKKKILLPGVSKNWGKVSFH